LIDEWVAYARQLHDQMDLPAGTFETQFTFAQALTESVKMAKNCLLVVSLPASDTTASPHAQADDAEVGGVRGREALDRLRNVIGRLESSIAASRRSSPPSAARPTTSGASRQPTRSILRSSTACTRTGPRWSSSSAHAACCV